MTISKRYLNILEIKNTGEIYGNEWTFRVKGHSQLRVFSVVIYSEDKSDWYMCTGMSASLRGSINGAYG